jgi:hypothetical protein
VATIPVFAVKPNGPSADNGLNKGNSAVNNLYLYEKDPTDWSVVEKGAWGKLKFNSNNFTFNGHKLMKETEYALIYYGADGHNDELPYATCIVKGFSNKGGNIHLSGEYDLGSFMDDAIPQKIWLVLAGDIDCENNQMICWNPTEYLFECDVI